MLGAEGVVAEREQKNPNLPTGDVEVRLTRLLILNTAQTPPIPLEDGAEANEDLRLKYRFLDLRRESLQRNLVLRSEVAEIIRNYFRRNDFVEVETPVLGKSTPKGPGTTWCPAGCTRASSTPCPSRPSSTSSCSRWPASNATSSSAAASGTRTCGPTASPSSPRWTWR